MNHSSERLRKAAIFVASLDDSAAAGVYASLPVADATQLRAAVAELVEVDAEEQEAILAEFLAERSRHADDVGVELDRNLARRLADYERAAEGDDANSSPLVDDSDDLAEVSADELIQGLEGEHPQTIAVVLARVEPMRAAETLRAWEPERRHEILRRIASLAPTPPELLREITQELFARLRRRADALTAARRSEAQVEAILAAADEPLRSAWRAGTNGPTTARPIEPADAGAGEPDSTRSTESRDADASPLGAGLLDDHSPSAEAAGAPESTGGESAPFTWAEVARFDDQVLARLFASAAPELVRLALAGADETLLDRMRRHLGPKAARALDRQIQRLDAVRIGDIVEAQERLAELAERLARRGELAPR